MKHTEFEKLSKRERKRLNNERRGSWNGVVPVTKVVQSKKLYNRRAEKARAADYRASVFSGYSVEHPSVYRVLNGVAERLIAQILDFGSFMRYNIRVFHRMEVLV
jgi:hypothetical protein